MGEQAKREVRVQYSGSLLANQVGGRVPMPTHAAPELLAGTGRLAMPRAAPEPIKD
jgi:hypothetical protein